MAFSDLSERRIGSGDRVRFVAPEIYRPTLVDGTVVCTTPESDMYSYGQICWEVSLSPCRCVRYGSC